MTVTRLAAKRKLERQVIHQLATGMREQSQEDESEQNEETDTNDETETNNADKITSLDYATSWKVRFNQLQSFKEQSGQANPTEGPLADWLDRQRELFRLVQSHVVLLRDLGCQGFEEITKKGMPAAAAAEAPAPVAATHQSAPAPAPPPGPPLQRLAAPIPMPPPGAMLHPVHPGVMPPPYLYPPHPHHPYPGFYNYPPMPVPPRARGPPPRRAPPPRQHSAPPQPPRVRQSPPKRKRKKAPAPAPVSATKTNTKTDPPKEDNSAEKPAAVPSPAAAPTPQSAAPAPAVVVPAQPPQIALSIPGVWNEQLAANSPPERLQKFPLLAKLNIPLDEGEVATHMRQSILRELVLFHETYKLDCCFTRSSHSRYAVVKVPGVFGRERSQRMKRKAKLLTQKGMTAQAAEAAIKSQDERLAEAQEKARHAAALAQKKARLAEAERKVRQLDQYIMAQKYGKNDKTPKPTTVRVVEDRQKRDNQTTERQQLTATKTITTAQQQQLGTATATKTTTTTTPPAQRKELVPTTTKTTTTTTTPPTPKNGNQIDKPDDDEAKEITKRNHKHARMLFELNKSHSFMDNILKEVNWGSHHNTDKARQEETALWFCCYFAKYYNAAFCPVIDMAYEVQAKEIEMAERRQEYDAKGKFVPPGPDFIMHDGGNRTNPQHVEWNCKFLQLQAYKTEHGNCDVKRRTELGRWVMTLKTNWRLKKLSQGRINALKTLDFVFEAIDRYGSYNVSERRVQSSIAAKLFFQPVNKYPLLTAKDAMLLAGYTEEEASDVNRKKECNERVRCIAQDVNKKKPKGEAMDKIMDFKRQLVEAAGAKTSQAMEAALVNMYGRGDIDTPESQKQNTAKIIAMLVEQHNKLLERETFFEEGGTSNDDEDLQQSVREQESPPHKRKAHWPQQQARKRHLSFTQQPRPDPVAVCYQP